MKTTKKVNIITADDIDDVPVSTLAQLIGIDWPAVRKEGVGFMRAGCHPANPYWQAMAGMDTFKDSYGVENGRSMGEYFLANAQGWRGEQARIIKTEIRRRLDALKN